MQTKHHLEYRIMAQASFWIEMFDKFFKWNILIVIRLESESLYLIEKISK